MSVKLPRRKQNDLDDSVDEGFMTDASDGFTDDPTQPSAILNPKPELAHLNVSLSEGVFLCRCWLSKQL